MKVEIIGTDIKTVHLIAPLSEMLKVFQKYTANLEFNGAHGKYYFSLREHGLVSGELSSRDNLELMCSINHIWISGASGDCLLSSLWDLVDRCVNSRRLDMYVFYSDNHMERLILNGNAIKSLEKVDKTVFDFLSEIGLGGKLNREKADRILTISRLLQSGIEENTDTFKRVSKLNNLLVEYKNTTKEQDRLENEMMIYLQGKERSL